MLTRRTHGFITVWGSPGQRHPAVWTEGLTSRAELSVEQEAAHLGARVAVRK